MTTSDIKPGDKVTLTDGGIQRKVISVTGDMAHCIWEHQGTTEEGDFPLVALEKVPPPPKQGFHVGQIEPPGGGL